MVTDGQPITVPYRIPAWRALVASKRAGLSAFVAALLVATLPILLNFLDADDWSRGAVHTLLIGIAVAAHTVILTYAQMYREARADDAERLGG